MSVMYEGSARIGISQYWMMFVGSLIVSVVAIAVAIFSFLASNLFLVVIAVLVMFASGIYLRVAEMKRCRDIGWPAELPWIFFAILVVLAMVSFQGGLVSLASSGLSIVISLADLGFAILVGCIPGKQWQPPSPAEYREHHSADDYSPAAAEYGVGGEDDEVRTARFDDAIARALATRQQNAATGQQNSETGTSPANPPARATGFGRKGMGGQLA